MSSLNKINPCQKEILAIFMSRHPDLAKNVLSCPQGKATSTKLWNELAKKLNSKGPPVKDSKSWRKTFSDQKYQIKNKISFNKSSKKRTGGGPYEEKHLSQLDLEISSACGLDVAVEGIAVKTFGKRMEQHSQLLLPAKTTEENARHRVSSLHASENTDWRISKSTLASNFCAPDRSSCPQTLSTPSSLPSTSEAIIENSSIIVLTEPLPSTYNAVGSSFSYCPNPSEISPQTQNIDQNSNSSFTNDDGDLDYPSQSNFNMNRRTTYKKRNLNKVDAKIKLIKNKMKEETSFYEAVCQKLDRHLELEERLVCIQERFLQMEEQKHRVFMDVNSLKHQIKEIQLAILKEQ